MWFNMFKRKKRLLKTVGTKSITLINDEKNTREREKFKEFSSVAVFKMGDVSAPFGAIQSGVPPFNSSLPLWEGKC